MSKLLVIFSILLFLIPTFFLLIYRGKSIISKKTRSLSPLITSREQQEHNPDVDTNDWDLHKKRLFKFGRSQYKGLTFFLSSEDRIYYLSDTGTKIYC